MHGVVELAARRMVKPPEPVLDHFAYDRSIADRPDAAEWGWRCQAAAGRRRADGHCEQPIVVANPRRPVEEIDVKAVGRTTRPHIDS